MDFCMAFELLSLKRSWEPNFQRTNFEIWVRLARARRKSLPKSTFFIPSAPLSPPDALRQPVNPHARSILDSPATVKAPALNIATRWKRSLESEHEGAVEEAPPPPRKKPGRPRLNRDPFTTNPSSTLMVVASEDVTSMNSQTKSARESDDEAALEEIPPAPKKKRGRPPTGMRYDEETKCYVKIAEDTVASTPDEIGNLATKFLAADYSSDDTVGSKPAPHRKHDRPGTSDSESDSTDDDSPPRKVLKRDMPASQLEKTRAPNSMAATVKTKTAAPDTAASTQTPSSCTQSVDTSLAASTPKSISHESFPFPRQYNPDHHHTWPSSSQHPPPSSPMSSLPLTTHQPPPRPPLTPMIPIPFEIHFENWERDQVRDFGIQQLIRKVGSEAEASAFSNAGLFNPMGWLIHGMSEDFWKKSGISQQAAGHLVNLVSKKKGVGNAPVYMRDGFLRSRMMRGMQEVPRTDARFVPGDGSRAEGIHAFERMLMRLYGWKPKE